MPTNDPGSWNPLTRLRQAFRSGSPKPTYEERRQDLRLPAHGPLAVVRQVDGAERTERVHLIGASERGLSFRAPSHITPSETVRITDDQADASFKAVVRHCSPDNDGYTVGVEVVKESPQESSDADAAAAD